MVICKYFMEGYCKHGSRCRFDHATSYRGYDSDRSADFSSGDRPVGTSILKGANTSFVGGQVFDHGFIQSQQQNYQHKLPVASKFNVQEVMLTVSKDVLQAEKGNQWQLSSYSPFKDLANFPGLEDHSPEELRWECYKALQNGTLPLCQAIVQQLCANVAKINNELKKKETAYALIDKWLRATEETTQSNLSASSTFASSNTSLTGFTNPAPLYSQHETQTNTNSAFTFSLAQQQPVNLQTYPSSVPAYGSHPPSSVPAYGNHPPSSVPAYGSHPPSSVPAYSSHQMVVPPPSQHYQEDSQAYSTTEELVEAELEAFKMDRFVLGSIPTKPPPKFFCNK